MKLIYDVKDKPKFGQLIVFAIQQLLAIMAATLVVPVIINGNAGLSGDNAMSTAAALFGAGVGTLIYIIFTRKKSPVFLGSSFAFIGSMTAAFVGAGTCIKLGYIGLILGALFAGLVYVLIAIIVKFVGVKWISKIMPAVVIGPIVAIIGLSLAGSAISSLTTTNYTTVYQTADYTVAASYQGSTDENGTFTYLDADSKAVATKDEAAVTYSITDKDGNACQGIDVAKNDDGTYTLTQNNGSMYIAILCGLITLGVTMICSCYGKKTMKLIPFIIGILSGYAAASVFYGIGCATGNEALKIIDYSALTSIFQNFSISSLVAVPKFTFLTAFGAIGEINASYIATIAVAYIPVAFVVFAEHIADHKNLSSIIERDLLEDPGLHRTLLGDGVGSMVGAFFGGCPNTTYGESIGCVAITRNASVYSIIAAAICAMVISFITPFVAFVNTIPSCVMGGVCIALYGFIAVSGLKMIQDVDLDDNRNLFVVSAILIAGIGGLQLTFGKITITEVACALILGVLVNILLSRKKKNA